jgi:hypothetical protein
MLLPFGKVISGGVVSPFKGTKDYISVGFKLKEYEKKNKITPLKKMKRKLFKSDERNVDLNQQIANPLLVLLKRNSANTTDVFFVGDRAMVSCSYQMKQGMMNKKTKIICNCISDEAKTHSAYYYIALCRKYNIVTSNMDELLAKL